MKHQQPLDHVTQAFNDQTGYSIRDTATGQIKTIRPMDAKSYELPQVAMALGQQLTREMGVHVLTDILQLSSTSPSLRTQSTTSSLVNRVDALLVSKLLGSQLGLPVLVRY